MKFFNQYRKYVLQAPEDDKGGGGGGGGTPDPAKELAELKAKFEAQQKELETLKGKKPDNDPDLAGRAAKDREEKEKAEIAAKNMESAIGFVMGSTKWLETNAALLPENIKDIFAQAEKEKYGSATEKANDLKVGIVSEYFAKQSNLDLLTDAQKKKLAQFLDLTKNVKQERVNDVYESIFEPTLEMARQIKKAQELQKGLAPSDGKHDAYKKRLIDGSRKHHLREKQ